MKKLYISICIITAVLVLFSSCEEENETKPLPTIHMLDVKNVVYWETDTVEVLRFEIKNLEEQSTFSFLQIKSNYIEDVLPHFFGDIYILETNSSDFIKGNFGYVSDFANTTITAKNGIYSVFVTTRNLDDIIGLSFIYRIIDFQVEGVEFDNVLPLEGGPIYVVRSYV